MAPRETKSLQMGFKIAVRPGLLPHNKSKLYILCNYHNLVILKSENKLQQGNISLSTIIKK